MSSCGRHPLGRVDHAPLERRVDLPARDQDSGPAGPRDDLAAQVRHPHLEALVVADGGDLLLEPAGHLRRDARTGTRHEVEGSVGLFPQAEAVTLRVPGAHALCVHPERHGREPLHRRLALGPVVRGAHERLDGSLGRGVEAVERANDLAAREHLDPQAATAHLVDYPGELLGRALVHVERRRPGRGHPPLDLGLGDHARGFDGHGRARRGQRPARGDEEPAPLGHRAAPASERSGPAGVRRSAPRGTALELGVELPIVCSCATAGRFRAVAGRRACHGAGRDAGSLIGSGQSER